MPVKRRQRVPGPPRKRWALRRKCPACGGGPMFESLFRMRESCPACEFRFTRETGYWLGAMYINYGVAVAVTILLHFVMTDGFQIPIRIQMAILLPLAVILVLLFFGTSRALFLAMDLSFDPPQPKDFGRSEEAAPPSDSNP